MKYIKDKKIIEAIRWEGSEDSMSECLRFMEGNNNNDSTHNGTYLSPGVDVHNNVIYVPLYNGNLQKCRKGDWIIRGVRDSYYSCTNTRFCRKYKIYDENKITSWIKNTLWKIKNKSIIVDILGVLLVCSFLAFESKETYMVKNYESIQITRMTCDNIDTLFIIKNNDTDKIITIPENPKMVNCQIIDTKTKTI